MARATATGGQTAVSDENAPGLPFRNSIERATSTEYEFPVWFLDDVVGMKAYRARKARHLAGVAVHGDRLVIRLTRPSADLATRLAMPFFCAVPRDTPIDPRGVLIKEINSRGLGLTVCPISNSYVTDGLKAGEIKRMLDQSVRATVNSDDPAYFPGYMNENFAAVQEAVNLTRDEIVQLARNAFTVSWLVREDRVRYADALEAHAANPS